MKERIYSALISLAIAGGMVAFIILMAFVLAWCTGV